MIVPLFVGRDKSISALNEVMKKDKKIILVTQKNSEVDDPKKTDVFLIKYRTFSTCRMEHSRERLTSRFSLHKI